MPKAFDSFFKSNSMMEVLSPIIISSRLTGIAPFEYIIVPGKSKTKINIWYVIWTFITLTAYAICWVVVMISDWEIAGKENIYIYTEKFRLYTGTITLGCIAIFRFIRKDSLSLYFEYLHDIDKMFEELGYKRDYTTLKRNIFNAVVLQQLQCVTCMIIITYLSPMITSATDIPMFIMKYSPTYNITFTQFICSSYIYLIGLNLRTLSKEVRKMYLAGDFIEHIERTSISRDSTWKNKNLQPRNYIMMEKLDVAWKVYAKICDCCYVLNGYYSIMAFAMIAGSFLNVLFNTFSLMRTVVDFTENTVIDWEILSMAIVEGILNITNMVIVIHVCNRCELEAKETARIINNMMATETNTEIANKLHQCSTHMLHTYPKFTAGGLFQINNTLHFTITGAITTYMIILFQFS